MQNTRASTATSPEQFGKSETHMPLVVGVMIQHPGMAFETLCNVAGPPSFFALSQFV